MLACGAWNLAPSEFWRMHPREFWLFFESKIPPEKLESPADKWEEMYQLLDDV